MEATTIPAINPQLVPTISPGRLFTRLTTDPTLAIRWLAPREPVVFEVLNRPTADEALRALIIAKAVDSLSDSLGHNVLFPFLVQPRIASGTTVTDVPLNWVWDISASVPMKWESLRLAKIKRISGANSSTAGYSGYLRLIFTASLQGTTSETAVLYADYQIDSILEYQVVRLQVVPSTEEINAISADQSETLAGFITFRAMDVTNAINIAFLELVAPPTNTTSSLGNGYFDNPAVYEIVDTIAGGSNITDDFSAASVTHGSGILTDSAYNSMPQLSSDIQSWLAAFNYPFDSNANRISNNNIIIPIGLFNEFNICAPAGDEPNNASTGSYFPVWVNRIELVATNRIRFFFATHNTTETETGGSPSLAAVEFATLDLLRTMTPGQIVQIVPNSNLKLQEGLDKAYYNQGFGAGHVVLSSLWDNTTSIVSDFFQSFTAIIGNPQDAPYSQSSTRLSSYAISRVPKYTPTVGQSRALLGSTSRLSAPISPSESNRYVTEADQGLGDTIDLEAVPGINPHPAFERYGYTGSLCHRVVKLIVDATKLSSADSYDEIVNPRLRQLFGRDPIFGDVHYNGTRFMIYNGDTWQSPG